MKVIPLTLTITLLKLATFNKPSKEGRILDEDRLGRAVHSVTGHYHVQQFSISFPEGERNMQMRHRMWPLILAAIFLITACSQNKESAKSLVGMQAPAFQLDDARGGKISLSDYTQKGTPVLLFFHMAVG